MEEMEIMNLEPMRSEVVEDTNIARHRHRHGDT